MIIIIIHEFHRDASLEQNFRAECMLFKFFVKSKLGTSSFYFDNFNEFPTT